MLERTNRQQSCDCKVGRSLKRYSLTELNERLIECRSLQKKSLRDLSGFINQRLLESAIEDTSLDILNGDGDLYGAMDREDAVATIYHALCDDEVSAERRARVETRLRQAGVDLEEVKDNWVTHTTVRRHLNDCLDLDTSSNNELTPGGAISTIEWTHSRCTAISQRTLERLKSVGELESGNLDISVHIQVTCSECGITYRPHELVERGKCDCEREESQK